MKSKWCTIVSLSFVLILTPAIRLNVHQPSSIHPIEWNIALSGCEDILNRFTENDNWIEQLIDPVLTTPDEISGRLTTFSKVHDCIGNAAASLSDEQFMIRTLTEYFLIFAGGAQTPESETTLYIISFKQSTDPAIVKIRDEAGIPAPEGYIFVRFYSSREIMPDLVKRAFKSEDVLGVTILMRYIAVLNEEKGTWPEQALQNQTLPETISHELVHAYVNATLGLQELDLPKWYQEGLAIYFSGSGKEHSIITPDFSISTTLPEEYQQYNTNFKYLEAKLGRKNLLDRIKRSVDQADPSVLYQDLDIANDQILAARASAWQQHRYFVEVGVFILVVLLLGWGVKKLMPEVRCQNCNYTGKKKDFIYGYCPKCHRRYDRRSLW